MSYERHDDDAVIFLEAPKLAASSDLTADKFLRRVDGAILVLQAAERQNVRGVA